MGGLPRARRADQPAAKRVVTDLDPARRGVLLSRISGRPASSGSWPAWWSQAGRPAGGAGIHGGADRGDLHRCDAGLSGRTGGLGVAAGPGGGLAARQSAEVASQRGAPRLYFPRRIGQQRAVLLARTSRRPLAVHARAWLALADAGEFGLPPRLCAGAARRGFGLLLLSDGRAQLRLLDPAAAIRASTGRRWSASDGGSARPAGGRRADRRAADAALHGRIDPAPSSRRATAGAGAPDGPGLLDLWS